MQQTETLTDLFKKADRLIKLYTLHDGIAPKFLLQLLQLGNPDYEWVTKPEEADYLVFPCDYHVAHDLPHFYNFYKGTADERAVVLQYEEQLMALSKKLNKKILIFFNSDSSDEIKVDNAIIFRSTIIKSQQRVNEFSLPVLKNDLSVAGNSFTEFIKWEGKPSIGFRGMAQPFKFAKQKTNLRNNINLLANFFNRDDIFNLRKNHGYLERRNAMVVLRKNKKITTDFFITESRQLSDANSTQRFTDTVFKNAYTLCVSGDGNFSYRFFETLSAGRIPVFVDTDCKLPFEEFINWKDHVVWVERKDIYRVDKILLAFHHNNKKSFIEMQQQNKALWKEYLSPGGFLKKIKLYL